MSTNPSIVFYQGLRCTKVPRQPRATDSPSPSTEANTPSSTAETSAENAASQTSLDQPTSNEDSTSITVSPITTTSSSYSGTDPSSSSQTTSQELESHSSELDTGIHSTASNSALHTTFTTETFTTPQPSTSSQPVPSVSNNDSTGLPYATIFGALFGALGFIALVAVIIFLIRHRSRRSSGGLQDDRASTDSRTGLRRDFRSQMSYLSDASPTSSIIL
ncbi:hypothetical protein BDW62DRAFT_93459 [Aspergillus aurantiobrunneus]